MASLARSIVGVVVAIGSVGWSMTASPSSCRVSVVEAAGPAHNRRDMYDPEPDRPTAAPAVDRNRPVEDRLLRNPTSSPTGVELDKPYPVGVRHLS